MRILLAAALACLASSAWASCEFDTSGTCYTDNMGNTYRTQQNFGGGYNTYRNGALDSQTSQNLNGGYTQRYSNGYERNYDSDPYAPQMRGSSDPYRIKTYDDY